MHQSEWRGHLIEGKTAKFPDGSKEGQVSWNGEESQRNSIRSAVRFAGRHGLGATEIRGYSGCALGQPAGAASAATDGQTFYR
jgi:hypothetical protein